MVSTFILALAAAASPAVSDQTTTNTATTLQQKFDKASKSFTEGRCRDAITEYKLIEKDPRIRVGSLPAATIALRKGICLTRTGSADEGKAAIFASLQVMEAAGPDFDEDVAMGWMAIGHASYHNLEYAEATQSYQRALAKLKGYNRLDALAGLAKSTTFDGTPQALSYAQEAIALINAQPTPDQTLLAMMHTLHARTLLNQGKAAEAHKTMQSALRLSGGLSTSNVKLTDMILRSDLAMAALQAGQKQLAQTYLAYTGVGRQKEARFSIGSMPLPSCSQETGLRPEDVAVVEFALSDDGQVEASQTIFSRAGPQAAAVFAKAVRDWRWKAEEAAKISPIFRANMRFELRCSTAPQGTSVLFGPLAQRLQNWSRGPLHMYNGRDLREEDLRKISSDIKITVEARIAALALLAYTCLETPEERIAVADQALALSQHGAQIPDHVMAWLKLMRAPAMTSSSRAYTRPDPNGRARRDWLLKLASDPIIANDPLAHSATLIDATQAFAQPEDTELLKRVSQDNRLDEQHPLRRLAWLKLTDRAAAEKNNDAAQNYFSKSRFTPPQCTNDTSPQTTKQGAFAIDYPAQAMQLGFEGWAKLEYDIGTDGKPSNIRPIIAHPPFVFANSAIEKVQAARYEPSFRPGTTTACQAAQVTVRFILAE